ncbi:MAG: hypothetical protein ACXW0I_04010 [Methylosarcina sp.]
MDALATIPVEIQVTFAGVLVVALVTILEILDLRRALHKHKQKIQELLDFSRSQETQSANAPRYGFSSGKKKYCLVSTFSMTMQFIFGLAVLAVFSRWALYLVNQGFIGSAVVSGLTAIVGIVMPFIVWLTYQRKSREMAQLLQEIESRPLKSAATEKPPVAPAPQLAGAELEEIKWKPAAVEKTVDVANIVPESAPAVTSTPKPVVEVSNEAQAVPEATPLATAAVSEIHKKIPYEEKIPEDSMLRRHYLTHIQSRKQPEWTARPTDSMLRRHYDSLMASLQQSALPKVESPLLQAEPVRIAGVKIEEGETKEREAVFYERLPQDSMLRRHYLTSMRYRLELALPLRPTDSILMRHFDNWKNVQLDREIQRSMERMNTQH